MRSLPLLLITLLAAGCGEPQLVLDFSGVPERNFGIDLDASCSSEDGPVEVGDGECRTLTAGDTSLRFDMDAELAGEATCSFVLGVLASCEDRLFLISGNFQQQIAEASETNDIRIDATQLYSSYDDDGDGATNYVEHIVGTDPRSAASRPLD